MPRAAGLHTIAGALLKRFKSIGHYHFGSDDKDDPVESLKQELNGSDYGDSLIVLPDAFNVPGG